MRAANLAVRFCLELVALAALGYWGWSTLSSTAAKAAAGLAAPLTFALAWGRWISPKAPRRLPDPVRLAVEVALFGLVVLAVAAVGTATAALVLAITVGVNLTLMVRWRQRGL